MDGAHGQGDPPEEDASVRRRRRIIEALVVGLIVSLIATVIGGIIVLTIEYGFFDTDAPAAATTPTPTPSATQATGTSTPPIPTSGPGPTLTPPAPTPTVDAEKFLSDLEPVKGDYVSTDPVTMDGTEYTQVVRTNRHPFDPYEVEYNLNSQFSEFSALVGFADESSTKYEWRVQATAISGGNRTVLIDEVLADGQVRDVSAVVDGVARFEISVRLADTEPLSATPTTDYPVVWALPKLEQ